MCVKVCRGCYMKTLDETQMFITIAVTNSLSSTSGVTLLNLRGTGLPVNKTSPQRLLEVQNHINSIPAYISHYTRRKSDKKYLPAFMNMQMLYILLYCNAVTNSVCKTIYQAEFEKHKSVLNTCHYCDMLETEKKMAHNEEAKAIVTQKKEKHLNSATDAYLKKKFDKIIAKGDNGKVHYTFDLQQYLPTPNINSNVSFYKRQV